ncbi:alpha/beta fold hydrolase [Mycobacteroides salmoniphilum]|uniref:alpha/beta fold hydrolase n=1 Tax=Mycobacteroides salmoniphilum TaxID=404941 RepID=UPI000993FEE8|nr:alpha/beta hydrolase [Mycobacteroides salmoniphilum]QCH26082.1 Soluble epoxide hydrolase [Mycobacteroides salmoniphilum]
MTQRSMPVLEGVDHQYVQAGDVKIHVAVAGPQDGRPVVLLHGWPENWWMWHKVIPALADAGYRVHAMDLRGAGWSEVAATGYEKEQFASDVLAAADALGLESFDLVGHDWGGWTAQLVALKAPSRIRRLAILNIPPVWQEPGRVARHAHKLAYQLVVGAPVVGPLSHLSPTLWWFIRRSGMPKDSVDFFRGCFRDRDRRVAGSKIYRSMVGKEFAKLARGPYDDQKLAMPVRVLFGLDDVAVHPSLLDGFTDHADDLNITEVPNCGHFIVDEQPELVVKWLTEVLAEPAPKG